MRVSFSWIKRLQSRSCTYTMKEMTANLQNVLQQIPQENIELFNPKPSNCMIAELIICGTPNDCLQARKLIEPMLRSVFKNRYRFSVLPE